MLTLVMIIALSQAPDAPLRHQCGTVEHKPDGGVDATVAGCANILNVGTPTPYAGLLLDEQEDVHRTSREEGKTVELKELKTGNFIMPPGAYVGITGGAVGVAIALTLALLAGTGHLK
jgi:hypothetical protein